MSHDVRCCLNSVAHGDNKFEEEASRQMSTLGKIAEKAVCRSVVFGTVF